MSVNLNKHYVEAVIFNLMAKEQKIKLPISRQSLNKALLEFNIIKESDLSVEAFDKPINTVRRIEKLNDFKIESPTNIYYLNEYLTILKEKELSLSAKMIINTKKLKEEISTLLNMKNSNPSLKEIVQARKGNQISSSSENKKQENQKEQTDDEKKKSKPKTEKKEKPMFRIDDILRKQRERKSKNGK